MQPHCASTASLVLILHLSLGALDFISIFEALASGEKGEKNIRKKELAWPSDTIRKFKNTWGQKEGQVSPSLLLCPSSLFPCSRGHLIMYELF